MAEVHARYEFGDFVLDAGQQRLTRRASGEVIPLSGRVFDTLLFLVEHAGEPLHKDELLRAIWPDVIVEENSLAQNISTLRQALGEARGEKRYIATIARRGYQFVATVRRCDADAPTPGPVHVSAVPTRRARLAIPLFAFAAALIGLLTWWIARPDPDGAPNAALAQVQTLAILPFKPLVPDERDASLELGMAETLIARIGQGRAAAVRPLSSVRRYAAESVDALAAGRELDVDTVLEGSLQRSGERLRVSVRLLRVEDGELLWTQTFDEDFTSIFEVQDAIAARVTEAMPAISPASTRVPPPATRDPEAYVFYASGRFAWTRQDEASLRRAIGFFEQAIARDPQYALAYAGLADSYAVLGVFGIEAPHAVFPRARAAAQRALEIDPDLAAAHSAAGHIKVQYEHDWTGAERDYARAMQLDPALALTHHRIGLLQAMRGDIDAALASAQTAQQLEPLWLPARATAANYLYYARRHDESIEVSQQVLALDERSLNARGFLIRNLIAKGDFDRALAQLDAAPPLQMPGSHAFRAQALALSGRRPEALAELDRVMSLSTQRYVAAYDIALIHSALGDIEVAFTWLEKAMEDRSTLVVFLAQEPMFDALRSDPRFGELVARIGVFRQEPDT
jgi:DNA-binding winged helix-turn-helix (wHTH) protein/TolB-like protein/tetratricopeptide (TPR) repeat protein